MKREKKLDFVSFGGICFSTLYCNESEKSVHLQNVMTRKSMNNRKLNDIDWKSELTFIIYVMQNLIIYGII